MIGDGGCYPTRSDGSVFVRVSVWCYTALDVGGHDAWLGLGNKASHCIGSSSRQMAREGYIGCPSAIVFGLLVLIASSTTSIRGSCPVEVMNFGLETIAQWAV